MKLDEIILVLKSSIGSMKSDISSTVSELKKLTSTTSTVTKTMDKVSKGVEPVANSLNKATNNASRFNNTLNKTPQQSYESLVKELKKAQIEYLNLERLRYITKKDMAAARTKGEKEETRNAPMITQDDSGKRVKVWADNLADAEAKMAALSQKISRLKGDVAFFEENRDLLDPIKQSADKAGQSMKDASGNSNLLSKSMKKLTKGLSSIATISSTIKGSIDSLSKKFSSFGKTASKSFDSLYFKMKKLGLGLLGIRTAMAFLTKSTQAYISFDSELQESITNSYQMLGALLAPAIIYVAQAFATAVNYIYQFVTALTGIDLVARANAKALQTQAKAAKGAAAAQRGLLAMDEITNLPTEPSGSGGGNAPQIDVGAIEPSNILNSIIDALKNGEWHRAGEIVAEGINKALGSIDWSKIQSGAQYVGTGLALFLNGVFELDWKLLGTTLGNGIQTAIAFAFGFVENFEFRRLGSGLATALNGVFQSINWAMLGQTVSDAIIGVFNMITTFFITADWEQIGEDIKTFLVNIDWKGIATAVFDAIKAAFGGVDELLTSIFGGAGASLIEVLIGSILLLKGVMVAFNVVLGITALAEAGVLWPIIAIIAAVVAVVAVIVLLIKHFDEIKEVVGTVFTFIWEYIKLIGQQLWDHIKGFIDGVKEIFTGIVDMITGPFKDTVRVIKLLLKGDLLGAIKAVGKGIANAFIRPLNVAIGGINTILTPLRAMIVALGKVTGKNWTMNNIKIPKIPTLEVGTNEIKAEGLYHLHEGEAVVPKKYNPATDGYNDGADNRQIIDLLIDLNSSMIQYAERPININMDSKKVAEATYDNIQMIHNNKNVSGVMTRS